MNEPQLFTAYGPEPRCLGRIWLAFGIMPIVSGALGALLSGGSAPVGFLAGVAAIFVIVAGALPAFLTLKQRGPISLIQTMWAGAALGNLPFAMYGFMCALFAMVHVLNGTISKHLVPVPPLVAGAVTVIALGTGLGAASAAVFWFIAIRGTDLGE